jgi:Trypsin-like peptidase domain
LASGFKLLSLIFVLAGVAAAQTAPPQAKSKADDIDLSAGLVPKSPARKDIPTIARTANGAIVTIVMAANDKPIAQGTGFLVSADGVIVTNYHVIEEGNVAIVKFPDGTILHVDGVLAADRVRDLAVIKIHGKTFRTLTLGNSERVQVGEEVVAIGNPLSLESTVSNGIVSGVRTDKAGKFLQITAPFTHGSSGGPLFNMTGEVIGITTLVYEGVGQLNFAIPVNDAKRLLLTRSSKLQSLPNEEPQAQTPRTPPSYAPSPSTSDLKDVLQWMQNSSPEGETIGASKLHIKLTDFNGCHVHFSIETISYGETTSNVEYFFNLSDMDPTSIDVYLSPYNYSIDFIPMTTNKREKISKKVNGVMKGYQPYLLGISFSSTQGSKRFANAFLHAVELCGGKPSTF